MAGGGPFDMLQAGVTEATTATDRTMIDRTIRRSMGIQMSWRFIVLPIIVLSFEIRSKGDAKCAR